MRVTILVDTNAPGMAGQVEAWLARWRGTVRLRSQRLGCGCHCDLYELDAPREALADLPAEVRVEEAGFSPHDG